MVQAGTALAAVGAVVVLESLGVPVISTIATTLGEVLADLGISIGGSILDALNPANWL